VKEPGGSLGERAIVHRVSLAKQERSDLLASFT
jgi:hypothetical protein